jgi:hypothetical protein
MSFYRRKRKRYRIKELEDKKKSKVIRKIMSETGLHVDLILHIPKYKAMIESTQNTDKNLNKKYYVKGERKWCKKEEKIDKLGDFIPGVIVKEKNGLTGTEAYEVTDDMWIITESEYVQKSINTQMYEEYWWLHLKNLNNESKIIADNSFKYLILEKEWGKSYVEKLKAKRTYKKFGL